MSVERRNECLQKPWYWQSDRYGFVLCKFCYELSCNLLAELTIRNNVASLCSQMSDVEQGGGTVFTAINISLWPKKGSAAFWYNLKPNGEGDFKTRHAACPVLTGSKWGTLLYL